MNILSWSCSTKSDSRWSPVPVSFGVYRSLVGNECIRCELCLCSAVKGASSSRNCASVQHENLAAYAILRKVLFVATMRFV